MLDFMFRLILAVNATSWMLVVYGIKEQWSFWIFSDRMTGIMLLLIPIVLSLVSIVLTHFLDQEGLQGCEECVLVLFI